jgi:hypothetical protein
MYVDWTFWANKLKGICKMTEKQKASEKAFWLRKQGYNVQHYCELCKCWTQGDARSIRAHEEANRHQNNVKKRLKRAGETKDFIKNKNTDQSISNSNNSNNNNNVAKPTLKRLRPGEVLGQYSIRNTIYLEGPWHTDILNHLIKTKSTIPQVEVALEIKQTDNKNLDEDNSSNSSNSEQDDDDDDEPIIKWIPCQVLASVIMNESPTTSSSNNNDDIDNANSPIPMNLRYRVIPLQDDNHHVVDNSQPPIIAKPQDLRIMAPPEPSVFPSWTKIETEQISEDSSNNNNDNDEDLTSTTAGDNNNTGEIYKGMFIPSNVGSTTSTAAAAATTTTPTNTTTTTNTEPMIRKRMKPTSLQQQQQHKTIE